MSLLDYTEEVNADCELEVGKLTLVVVGVPRVRKEAFAGTSMI